MYPANFYGVFPAFPRKDIVFVAMSFDPRFDSRWVNVIAPAIGKVEIDGVALRPVRLDTRTIGDSILTEILDGIGSARVVFADVTSVGSLEGRGVRSGNVMYEVGLAHATRLPEEVLLFRSDRDDLLFDTANVRVNDYSPEESPNVARNQLGQAIVTALMEVDLRRHLAVKAVADALDVPSIEVLLKCQETGKVEHPPLRTTGQALSAVSKENAIQRLLALGLLRVEYRAPTPAEMDALADGPASALMSYGRKPFGDAVFMEIATRMCGRWASETEKHPGCE